MGAEAWRPRVKKPEEVMETLEVFDLTGALRQATALAGLRSQDGRVLGAHGLA